MCVYRRMNLAAHHGTGGEVIVNLGPLHIVVTKGTKKKKKPKRSNPHTRVLPSMVWKPSAICINGSMFKTETKYVVCLQIESLHINSVMFMHIK
jgi:hypothetical protein